MTRRSVMFTPGDRPEMLRKAPAAGADVIVFDLEDAVAPDRKPAAREAVADLLGDPEFDPESEVCVRVNPEFGEDLAILDRARPDSLMLPKVTGEASVEALVARVDEFGDALSVLALIENAAGVLAAPEIAAHEAVDALVFGAEDLAADVGATRTPEGTEVLYARERVVIAASAAHCEAIDTVYTDIEDREGLVEETRFAIGLGYDGKMAIHPGQVGPINGAFTPDSEEVEWAERVLDARDRADEDGRGVFRVDDEMIDAPLIARAERIRERARVADRST
ncbi:HpcH/HpaI aldolase/citrate lyase family protein [Halalkalicoccus paucihalophilus]|uniref:HpcH/HpaI aldolase/citrate lyase family protein n=1 Tax=Halalkalicoccus paucihalophilus TaxID=1008153 RepID=A0A151ADV2_9EURY|nr:CoA ester lyase [Halalkalicoccus paucihalophilus]KYH25774.1 HpcH/HpaI aldolase/citrate lyase family protein [Halalkalicoccus paucihalophilus]